MLKHYLFYTSLNILNILVSLFMMIFLVSQLNTEDYASWGVYNAFLVLLLVVVNFGHREALFKFSSKGMERQLINTCRTSRKFICFGALLVLLFSPISLQLMLAGFYILTFHTLTLAAAIRRGQGEIVKDAGSMLLYRVFWFILCLGSGLAVSEVGLNMVLSAGIVAALLVLPIVAKRDWFNSTVFQYLDNTEKHTHRLILFRFFKLEIVSVALLKIGMVVFTLMQFNDAQLAGYNFSLQMKEAALMVMAPVSYIAFNIINKQLPLGSAQKLFHPILLAAICSTFGVMIWFFLGEWVMNILFLKYIEYYELSFLLLVSVIPASINMVLSYHCIAFNQEALYFRVMLCGLFFMIIITIVLAQSYALYAAAIAKILSEVLMTLLYWVIIRAQFSGKI